MRYNIGLAYVGTGAYVNEKFTLNPGQAVIVPDSIGCRLLADFPEWFEQFDGVEDILALGTVKLMEPYNYHNQAAAFEETEDDEDSLPPPTWDDDTDGADHTEEAPADLDEEVEPQTNEEVALEAAVEELVDARITAAVMEKLSEKSNENEE
jgi:hypothetical protein